MRTILGAIAGDIIGSYYERKSNAVKTKDFELFPYGSRFTDDTVMTLAIAKWLMEDKSQEEKALVDSMLEVGNHHLAAGYGGKFLNWLRNEPIPYKSWGNGSAMRVSAVGLWAETLEECLALAEKTAEVSHNHTEGIKGAQAVAACMFIALHWEGSEESLKLYLKQYVTEKFGYDLNRTLDDIRPTYHFDVSCQGSVPEAIIAFLEAKDFEDAVRNAVSLGGDADTQAAIAGSIAACVWPIPDNIMVECKNKLTPDLLKIAEDFDAKFNNIMYNVKMGESNSLMRKVTLLKDIDLVGESIRSNYKFISSPKQTFKISPDRIDSLKENEVFVFGSNLNGLHGGGTARIAYNKFGAIWGQGVGLQGQSYAIPTMQGGVETIKPYVNEFITFAKVNPNKNFLVTRIGCGIAGFRDEEIAPLFKDAMDVENIYLPKSFVDIITDNECEITKHLESFVEIQNFSNGYEQALKEMKSGGKRGHWIWYIFPQIAGLGYSHMSQMYGIKNLEEAKAYLEHPVLGKRLREITEVVLSYPADADPNQFMLMPIDAMKLKSCMTLFDAVSPNDIFNSVLNKFYNGERDQKTLLYL